MSILDVNEGILVGGGKETIAQVEAYAEEQMDALEVPMKIAMKMNVVVDEIYSNIALYSGASAARVICRKENGQLILIFADNGIPFDPLVKEDPDITLSLEERQIGGLGIFLSKKMTDSMEYKRQDGVNVVTVRKNLEQV